MVSMQTRAHCLVKLSKPTMPTGYVTVAMDRQYTILWSDMSIWVYVPLKGGSQRLTG